MRGTQGGANEEDLTLVSASKPAGSSAYAPSHAPYDGGMRYCVASQCMT